MWKVEYYSIFPLPFRKKIKHTQIELRNFCNYYGLCYIADNCIKGRIDLYRTLPPFPEFFKYNYNCF